VIDQDHDLLAGELDNATTEWIAGADRPGRPERIAAAAEVIRLFLAKYDDATAANWLWGTCRELDDRCPIEVLRSSTTRAETTPVVAAARSFLHDPGYI
jgi:uncharacterized protein (DUF2384 family)